ncbi:tripartite tricarboxylate transporter substrate-binding protein [Bosea vestrisii]|uniref:tripartite tricarboxylate transporter substrate-binding protein n=1 Tax=Bosea vestrisii TaxID=151416 RepID=UPI0024DF3E9D|nr:tripartite tricarboxylate transporter substrate-binding protein [Bosea vestrisii]WID95232.1 tripartite tricarboxylate transporter substrate-binding protein [Bosea vestrisii]
MRFFAMAGLALALAAAAPSHAQEAFPNQAIKLVVAFAPGGPADLIGRIVGRKLEELWKQPVVIENRGGAGGALATRQIARGEATGHQILVTTSAYAVNSTLLSNPGYDPGKDLAAIATVATTPNLIVVAPGGPIKSLADLVALARSRPLSYATAGVGTTPHLSAESIFRLQAGLDIRHVPHTGAGPALNAVMGGHVDIASVALSAATELAKTGTVRAIAVTTNYRVASLPDVPTTAESGYPGEDLTWVAFFVPAGTPAAVVTRINADINIALAAPEVRDALTRIGFQSAGGTVAEATGFVSAEVVKWGGIVKRLGLKVD